MSLSAAVIDALVAAGATVEQLAAAVKADLAEAEQRLANRRAKDAMRQRKSRASRNVTVTPRDSTDTAPNEYISNPPLPSETKVSSGKDTPAKSKKSRSFEFETPDWFKPDELEAWDAFARMRYRRKKPVDDYTAKQLFGRLRSIADAGWNIVDVMVKATVAQHDGFWMPDGRDSNIRRANESRAGPLDMEAYKARLARIERADATH